MTPVDAYVAALPAGRAERLAAVRALVHELCPGVTERIEWKMPVFARGDNWIAVASQKSYLSVYLGCRPDLAATVVASDPKLRGGKACVNIADTAPLPLAALRPVIAEVLGSG